MNIRRKMRHLSNVVKEFMMKPFIRGLAKKLLLIIVQKEKYIPWSCYWHDAYWHDAYMIAKKAYVPDEY